MGNCINMFWHKRILYCWSDIKCKCKFFIFEDIVNQPLCLNLHNKCNKIKSYIHKIIQQGAMMFVDLLNPDLKYLSLHNQFNAKFNFECQKNTYEKLMPTIPRECRTLVESNTSITFTQYQPILYIIKSIQNRSTKFFYTALKEQEHITHP